MHSSGTTSGAGKTFLYAWELGAHFGHVGSFAPFAMELIAQGHAVVFAVRETAQCVRLLPATARWFQAPLVAEKPAPQAPLNYSDILLRFGYDDPVVLRGLLAGWREIMQAVKPDLVIADHAPTAILAARWLGLPVMLFGAGFCMPPREDPFPGMRPWQAMPPAALAQRDAAALACINAALTALKAAPLARMSDLFLLAEDALMGVPELDHYPGRGPARYWGPGGRFHGVRMVPAWPDGGPRRIFGYLRCDHPHLKALIAALSRRQDPVLLCIPDWDHRFALGPTVRVVRDLLDLQAVARQVSLAIVYGGGTTTQLLAAGVPILCMPTHLENYLMGFRVAALGAGAVVEPDAVSVDFAEVIEQLLSSPDITAAARRFAARYAALDEATVVRNVVRRAVEVASQPR